jgi:hypothetical protein
MRPRPTVHKESLPTAKEINPFDTLDGRYAESHFLGKTLDEAEALFRQHSTYYEEDLMWMGPVAFCFYLRAALAYLRSPSAQGDFDFVSCVCGTLEFRLQYEGEALRRSFDTMVELCRYVLTAYDRFQIDETIYGDLRVRYRELLEELDAEPPLPANAAKRAPLKRAR